MLSRRCFRLAFRISAGMDGLLDEAARRELSLAETLALLCEAEVAHREKRRIQMGLGIAKFAYEGHTKGFASAWCGCGRVVFQSGSS